VTTALRLARPAAAAGTLAVVVWRLGAGPFLDGIRAVDGPALLAASAIGLVTTTCCAWRWTVVARGLGVRLTLPGGVAGDVHRGVTHGRDVRDLGRALRAVAWERAGGQAVQAVLTIAVLLVLPSPVRSSMPVVATAVVTTVAGAVLVGRQVRGGRWARMRDAVAGDIRAALLRRSAWPVVVLASGVVVAGHTVTFLVAARTAGVEAPTSRVLPLALLALLAMVLPSVAGWGPREGATAWVFASAGLGAGLGAATAVAYGVLVLVASLPGALVLLAGVLPGRAASPVVVRTTGAVDA
jgi:hypothetical protein